MHFGLGASRAPIHPPCGDPTTLHNSAWQGLMGIDLREAIPGTLSYGAGV